MAVKHPYMSGAGGIVQAVSHLRRSFPAEVTADTLKKLGIASNNETYVINILRFVGVLDDSGKKNSTAAGVFNRHEDPEFQSGFAEMIKSAYADLFNLHGDDAWSLPTDKLISFFRNTDSTSALVGQRQASTFQALAALGGKTAVTARPSVLKVKKAAAAAKPSPKKSAAPEIQSTPPPGAIAPAGTSEKQLGMALTVRVEINLPAGGDQDTYDRIFKSIRENLLNGNVA